VSAFVKKYPRARVSRHPHINGWVIDLIQRDGARPKRVAATYVTPVFAARAALIKLGVQAPAAPAAPRLTTPLFQDTGRSLSAPVAPAKKPATATKPTKAAGTCQTCNRPMRRAGMKAADHPGTVARRRDGLCQSCALRAEREGRSLPGAQLKAETVVEDIEFLHSAGAGREEIVERLGATCWDTIARMLYRAGRPDLIELVPAADPDKAAGARKARAA